MSGRPMVIAESLGRSERKGSLVPGKDAYLLILDTDLQINQTLVAGRVI
jgi:N-acetylglucosamine-6-phosphate deacetylase